MITNLRCPKCSEKFEISEDKNYICENGHKFKIMHNIPIFVNKKNEFYEEIFIDDKLNWIKRKDYPILSGIRDILCLSRKTTSIVYFIPIV